MPSLPALDDVSGTKLPPGPLYPPSPTSLVRPPFYILPDGEDSKSPALPPTSERIPGQNPEKFGSGNGANSRKNYSIKSVFPENTRFKREKTVQFRSVRKYVKTGPSGSLSRSPSPSGGRYGPKINVVIPAPENRRFFPGKTGRSGSRRCGFGAGGWPGRGDRPGGPKGGGPDGERGHLSWPRGRQSVQTARSGHPLPFIRHLLYPLHPRLLPPNDCITEFMNSRSCPFQCQILKTKTTYLLFKECNSSLDIFHSFPPGQDYFS